MKAYVTYLRVSTQQQGQSGLGLAAQRATVQAFSHGSPLREEFVEVEPGKKNQRPQLAAIALAKAQGAPLLIAKQDRFSRNAGFIFQLRDMEVDFVCCDMPDANTLTGGIFAVLLAQHERELISQRTKAALAAKRRRREGRAISTTS